MAAEALGSAAGRDGNAVGPAGGALRRRVVRDVGHYSVGTVVGGVGAMVNSYVAALLLGPPGWGLWQAVAVAYRYGQLTTVGIVDAMHREVPLRRGRGDTDGLPDVIATTFTFTVAVALATAGVVLAAAFTLDLPPGWRLAMVAVAAMVLAYHLLAFYEMLVRAEHAFQTASRAAMLRGIVAVASIGLVVAFGLAGFLAGQVVMIGATVGYMAWHVPRRVPWGFSPAVFRGLARVGLPMFAILLAGVVFATLDRVLVLRHLTESDLALYSLGVLVFAPFQMVFTASSAVLYPRVTERVGGATASRSLLNLLVVPLGALAVVMGLLIGVVYAALPLAVAAFLPEFLGGVAAAQVLMFGLVLYYLAEHGNNVLVALNLQRLRLVVLVGSSSLALVGIELALQMGLGIVGAAAATSASYLVYFAVTTYVALHRAGATAAEGAAGVARGAGPVVLAFAMAAGVTALLAGRGWAPEAVALSVVAALAAVFAFPVLRLARNVQEVMRA